MDWFYFLLGIIVALAINFFFMSTGKDYLISPFSILLVLICIFGLAICSLIETFDSETPAKKNDNESSCRFQLEQKHLYDQLNEWGVA